MRGWEMRYYITVASILMITVLISACSCNLG